MNGLYPIIRRVRRPLVPIEAPAGAKPAVVPVSAESKTSSESKRATHKEKHGEATTVKQAE
jgi:hypothetical protein